MSTDHDDVDGVHDDRHHRTQILACIFCLLHDAHTQHTLPVPQLQPPQLAFQHGVYAHFQDPQSPHASHKQRRQRRQELPPPRGARFSDACAPPPAGTASLDHHSHSAGMASLVVHTLPERRRVAHTLEPSVARMDQALAASGRSCMLERHCRRTMSHGGGGRGGDRGGRGSRGGDGLTWLLLLTEIALR